MGLGKYALSLRTGPFNMPPYCPNGVRCLLLINVHTASIFPIPSNGKSRDYRRRNRYKHNTIGKQMHKTRVTSKGSKRNNKKNIEYTEENFRFWPNYGKWYSKRNDKIYRNNNDKYRYFLCNDQEKELNIMEITRMINDDSQACKNQTIDLLYIDTRILLESLRLIIEIQNQICGYWLSV